MTPSPAKVTSVPRFRKFFVHVAFGSFEIEYDKNNKAVKVTNPTIPQGTSRIGMVLYWALPMTSSHEKIVSEAQKFAPSLTFAWIHWVWTETAKPPSKVRFSPLSRRPRFVAKEGNRPLSARKELLVNGRIKSKPSRIGRP